MKIIQINASYKPAYIYGGPALSISRLCEALVKAGAELEVLTTTANGQYELDVVPNTPQYVDGVKVTFFKRLTKDHTHFSPSLLKELYKKLNVLKKEKTPIIVHIHVWWNLVSILSCLIARLRKVPVLLTPRGTLSGYSFKNRNAGLKGLIHQLIGKPLLKYCHFHVTSAKEQEDLIELIEAKSIRVIPNFVYLPPIETIQDKVSRSIKQPFNFLFLSRIEEKKGLNLLLTALAEFDTPFHLTIGGTGEKEYINYLQNLANQLNISSFITWAGQQSQENKWAVMKHHDLMILPSHDENFANVVIECLSTGTPVLISDKVGLADYVSVNNLGWICKANKQSIKEGLLQFQNQPEKAINIRRLAPEKIRNDFNEKQLVQQFLKMYSKIVDSR